jgi:hypothetical protein
LPACGRRWRLRRLFARWAKVTPAAEDTSSDLTPQRKCYQQNVAPVAPPRRIAEDVAKSFPFLRPDHWLGAATFSG